MVDVGCGGCPILHMVWLMSSVVDVGCGGCLCGGCRTISLNTFNGLDYLKLAGSVGDPLKRVD